MGMNIGFTQCIGTAKHTKSYHLISNVLLCQFFICFSYFPKLFKLPEFTVPDLDFYRFTFSFTDLIFQTLAHGNHRIIE